MDALGSFLRSRRARLRPEQVGLGPQAARRRVPGLRREELAQLAGVSMSYYSRLEQGQGRRVSPSVLDAVATALRLSSDERRYLHTVAQGGGEREPGSVAAVDRLDRPGRRDGMDRLDHIDGTDRIDPNDTVRPGVARLIEMMGPVPAMVLNPSSDVLAWNHLAHMLLAPMARTRPNLTRMVFLEPWSRRLWCDWEAKASSIVGSLRMAHAHDPHDRRLRSVVDGLLRESGDFSRLWADHTVGRCEAFTNRLLHPLVGPLTLDQEVLRLEGSGQALITFTVERNSASEAALRALAPLPPAPRASLTS
jgi:transcriptional regulator with XRE-family HTH domain